MRPSALDEYPIHQTPLSMGRVATSDRNFYDRCYFNAVPDDLGSMVVAGAGVYPNLGVHDGFIAVRREDRMDAVRFSDALTDRAMTHGVGGLAVEVVEPLQRVRLRCESDALSADLTWTGSAPAILEEPHLLMAGPRPMLQAQRFAQAGQWAGRIEVDGATIDLDGWSGCRDRSWGIRPSGEPEPAGRVQEEEPTEGFYWVYCPLRFPDFTLVVILQESPDGYRTLNDARRVFRDGRVEQLGWPRVRVEYRSGTRIPLSARIDLTSAEGEPLTLELETGTFIPLHVGCGYSGDPEWTHGQWQGRGFARSTTYDMAREEIAGRVPWGVTDFTARARLGDAGGVGMFEHGNLGRHDPSGFADWGSVAP